MEATLRSCMWHTWPDSCSRFSSILATLDQHLWTNCLRNSLPGFATLCHQRKSSFTLFFATKSQSFHFKLSKKILRATTFERLLWFINFPKLLFPLTTQYHSPECPPEYFWQNGGRVLIIAEKQDKKKTTKFLNTFPLSFRFYFSCI